MSSSQPFVVGLCIDFQHFAIVRLAWSRHRVTIFLLALLRLKSFGMSPKTHIGRVTSEVFESVSTTSLHNSCNFEQDHKQWKRVPLWVSHFIQTSGILPLRRFRTPGLIKSLMDHLYCNSLKPELIVEIVFVTPPSLYTKQVSCPPMILVTLIAESCERLK